MRDPARLEIVERCAELAELTYRVTACFPASERYGLVAQMRRAAVSVGSNVAEGCGMSSRAAFLRYLHVATGSLLELEYQAMIAVRVGVAEAQPLSELRALVTRVKQMLSRLRSAMRAATRPARSAEPPDQARA